MDPCLVDFQNFGLKNMKYLVIILSSFLLIQCQTKSSKKAPVTTFATAPSDPKEDAKRAPGIRLLTTVGENRRGQFSDDGKRVLFLSRGRETHEQAQVYELNLTTLKEKRVTYHDGDDFDPIFVSRSSEIVYASTTDELKENPIFIAQALAKAKAKTAKEPASSKSPPPETPHLPRGLVPELPSSEIYISRIDGSQVERLTQLNGFDGGPAQHNRTLVFSSTRGSEIGREVANLYQMDVKGRGVRRLTRSTRHQLEPALSPDGKRLVWVEVADDLASSWLVLADALGQKPKVLTGPGFTDRDPTWTADGEGIVFSSNRASKDRFDLYTVRKDGSCLTALSTFENSSQKATSNNSEPAIDRLGKNMIFTSDRGGVKQIYLTAFVWPASCAGLQSGLK